MFALGEKNTKSGAWRLFLRGGNTKPGENGIGRAALPRDILSPPSNPRASTIPAREPPSGKRNAKKRSG